MRDEIRVLLITSKILQICADIFAVFGIFLFAYIYFTHFRDNPLAAVSDPFFVVTILIPFMPAAVMAWLAAKKRRQIRALIEQSQK